jgi:uridine kinase
MSTERPLIVIVAGGTASGKSTIVSQLVAATGAAHISHDRYYLNAPEPRGHDFDHPDALDTVQLVDHVAALKAGCSVALPVYDFASHSRTRQTELMGPSPVIVVEGILVLADSRLAALADLTVFVEAPEATRIQRRIDRDVRERGRTPAGVRDQYQATVKPNHDRFVQPSRAVADLVLDGCSSVDENVAALMAAIAIAQG